MIKINRLLSVIPFLICFPEGYLTYSIIAEGDSKPIVRFHYIVIYYIFQGSNWGRLPTKEGGGRFGDGGPLLYKLKILLHSYA